MLLFIKHGERNQNEKTEKEMRIIHKNDRPNADFNVCYRTQITAQLFLGIGIRIRFVIKITKFVRKGKKNSILLGR